MVVRASQDYNHRYERGGNEPDVYLDIGEHDKPPIPMPLFQFASALRTGYTASRVFTTGIPSAASTTPE